MSPSLIYILHCLSNNLFQEVYCIEDVRNVGRMSLIQIFFVTLREVVYPSIFLQDLDEKGWQASSLVGCWLHHCGHKYNVVSLGGLCFSWRNNTNVILLDEMGVGKVVQSIFTFGNLQVCMWVHSGSYNDIHYLVVVLVLWPTFMLDGFVFLVQIYVVAILDNERVQCQFLWPYRLLM